MDQMHKANTMKTNTVDMKQKNDEQKYIVCSKIQTVIQFRPSTRVKEQRQKKKNNLERH